MGAGLLNSSRPEWFAVSHSGPALLKGKANPPGFAWRDGVDLSIMGSHWVRVYEEVPGTLFPAQCPERHIESDGKFCLGIAVGEVSDPKEAEQWWESLRHYLLCQCVADGSGVWPADFALDHGEAGGHHETALRLARELAISEDYERAHADEPSWISCPKSRIVHRDGRAINGRTACPLGCTWKRRGRWGTRLRADCKQRDKVTALVIAERERRKALDDFWRILRSRGVECCGTMRDCELKKGRS